jgi:hypothetical protein
MGSSLLPHLRAIPSATALKSAFVQSNMSAIRDAREKGQEISTHPLREIPPQIGYLEPVPRNDTATVWRSKQDRRDRAEEEIRRKEAEEEKGFPQTARRTEKDEVSGCARPSILPGSAVDASSVSSHAPVLSFGSARNIEPSATGRRLRPEEALERLNRAVDAELAHLTCAPLRALLCRAHSLLLRSPRASSRGSRSTLGSSPRPTSTTRRHSSSTGQHSSKRARIEMRCRESTTEW